MKLRNTHIDAGNIDRVLREIYDACPEEPEELETPFKPRERRPFRPPIIWSDEEIDILLSGKIPVGKTRRNCYTKTRALREQGVECNGLFTTAPDWSDAELDMILNGVYPPNRTKRACERKIEMLRQGGAKITKYKECNNGK